LCHRETQTNPITLLPCGAGASRLPHREVAMKAIHSMIAAAVLSFVQPTAASAGINDPEVIIYRFPGVFDSGHPAAQGTATTFHCTNFSGVTENIRFVTRSFDIVIVSNFVFPIAHLQTLTASTHETLLYTD